MSVSKDLVSNYRFKEDTTKQGIKERSQERRNVLQDNANKQQLRINQSQLRAIQSQAKIAEDQFYQQQDVYKQQLYEQRPVFFIDSIHIDSINIAVSKFRFYVTNKGIRTAHIDSLVLAFYDPQNLCLSVTPQPSNLDLVPEKSFLATSDIVIYNECLHSASTIYYLLLFYKDKTTGTNQIEPIFFRYQYLPKHQFVWARVTGPAKEPFLKELKKKKVFVIE